MPPRAPPYEPAPLRVPPLDSQPPRFVERVFPRVPMRRWGVPEDFGAIAVYLTSDASAYHTGDTFVIDGGYAIF